MMTAEQTKSIESFTEKRDTLSLEVGLLTQEKETLLFTNKTLSELNTDLQSGIDKMRADSAQIGFEESEKVSKYRNESSKLEAEIRVLKETKEILSKDISEKNKTAEYLGIMIRSIKDVTNETSDTIKKMSSELTTYSNRSSEAAINVEHEANRIKKFTDELANVIDKERKINHDRTREIDAREIAVIGREKMVELQYAQAVKNTKK